tara:strand:+ start:10773 stop:11483 length:711 start_codon:yes stop_codon:yes gene_type:complete
MNGGIIFLIVLLLLGAGGYFGWYFYARWNATRNGLPPPSMNPIAAFKNRGAGAASNYPGPAPTGIKGFIDTQIRKFKNRNNRTAAGAYEEPAYGQPRGRGAGSRLDPDEAWSARVGDEAYYEEQELGLHEPASTRANPYANTNYAAPYPGAEPERGRSRNRESYEDGRSAQNPFGDDNAASLRGVSPRPLGGEDTSYHGGASVQMPKGPKHGKDGSINSLDSPTESRRSVFREDIR